MVRVHPCLPIVSRRLSVTMVAQARVERAERRESHVTLPDGSSRAVPAGTPRARTSRTAISPRLAKAALAAVVDGRLGRPVVSARARRVGPDRDARQPRGAAAVPPQHGAPARGGGHQPLSRHAVRHRSGDRRRLLLRLRRRRVRSCRRTSRRSKKKMQELAAAGPALRAADVAARRSEGVLRRAAASR